MWAILGLGVGKCRKAWKDLQPSATHTTTASGRRDVAAAESWEGGRQGSHGDTAEKSG
ncbi:hypothetical protein LR48_Vigan04g144600 [Vigna angularis]|uniref:Uncharacterized protein n=1 Tax=Phaseolus angularis TaxID=3914 RepID=A0A0L9UET4_PHAAN|nr:hypothetical protein LR48_Vigan04g144600 [Vigna angularis]